MTIMRECQGEGMRALVRGCIEQPWVQAEQRKNGNQKENEAESEVRMGT